MPNFEKHISRYRYFILLACCLLASLLNLMPQWKKSFGTPNQVLLIAGVLLVFCAYFLLYPREKGSGINEREIIFLIFAIGFIFRLVYVQSTPYTYRQHDVGGTEGHFEYIMRLYNGEGLPDGSFYGKFSQYYQPPLWHMLCAFACKLQTKLGIAWDVIGENLQMISLFCSSAIMFISHRLFRQFGLKKLPLIIACGIVAFHPTFIILSGSINNDILSLTLSLLSIVLAIKWFKKPSFINILLLALSIGLSMGVKLSGGLIALGVAMLFAIRLFGKEFKKKGVLIGQFASFGAVCVPLALWWQIRNFILYDVPLTYVPMLSERNSQYIGFRSVFERLFDFSSLWENGVYPARAIQSQAFEYYEYNIPLGALKTSVFGEYYLGQSSPLLSFCAKLLFWSAAVLVIIAVVATVYLIAKAIINRKSFCLQEGYTLSQLIFPAVCAATLLGSYVKFCFQFAHFCTMDFRYIAITVVFGALYIGLLLKDRLKSNKIFDKALVCCTGIATGVLMLSSLAVYGSIA